MIINITIINVIVIFTPKIQTKTHKNTVCKTYQAQRLFTVVETTAYIT